MAPGSSVERGTDEETATMMRAPFDALALMAEVVCRPSGHVPILRRGQGIRIVRITEGEAEHYGGAENATAPYDPPVAEGALGSDQATAYGDSHCLCPGIDVEFGEEVANMRLDRSRADAKGNPDFLVGVSVSQQAQDIQFAGG